MEGIIKVYNETTGQYEEWKDNPIPAMSEAPDDGKIYGRKNGGWEEASSVTSEEKAIWNNKADKIMAVSGSSGNVNITLSPNKLYKLGACTSITITLGAEIPNIYNEYMVQFTSSGVTTIGIPKIVKWSEFSDVSKIKANKIYQISIVGNLATIIGEK